MESLSAYNLSEEKWKYRSGWNNLPLFSSRKILLSKHNLQQRNLSFPLSHKIEIRYRPLIVIGYLVSLTSSGRRVYLVVLKITHFSVWWGHFFPLWYSCGFIIISMFLQNRGSINHSLGLKKFFANAFLLSKRYIS